MDGLYKYDMKLRQEDLDRALEEHKRVVEIYKEKYPAERKRDWRTYEQRLVLRIKTASRELEPILEEAYAMVEVSKSGRGRPHKVPLTKRVMILLLKDVFQLSNRRMANFLAFFTALTGIDLSYKSVERVYSDELARLVIHNMYVILLRRKGIKAADTSGDGTGYALTVTKHYRSEREKELKKSKASAEAKAKRKQFAYAFALMDLGTWMYIGYGTSMKSEKEAFRKAVAMAKDIGVSVRTARLDKYYSCKSITLEFDPGTRVYILPKKNAKVNGRLAWKQVLRSYVDEPYSHLREYFKRNNSESGFSADKRLCGWKVWQKREERIGTSLMCKGLWHNLMQLG